MPPEEVIRTIKSVKGSQLDPEVVDLFVSLCEGDRFAKIYQAAG